MPTLDCGGVLGGWLRRLWIGIDITYAAISVIRSRFKQRFGLEITNVAGAAPVTLQDAIALAESDPYQFQWWALVLDGSNRVGRGCACRMLTSESKSWAS